MFLKDMPREDYTLDKGMTEVVEVQPQSWGRKRLGPHHITTQVSAWGPNPGEPVWLLRELPCPRLSGLNSES